MVHGNKKLLYFLEMDDLENIMSCKELQRWAKENGLEDDPVVHLRDLELTLDKIKKKHETLKCDICNKMFTARKSLLRHQRTVHGGLSYECHLCNAKFGRLDVSHKHKKTHENKENSAKKRKLQQDTNKDHKKAKMTNSDMPSTAICNWCHHKNKVLVENKPFCVSCKKEGHECKQCHRPVPLHLFNTATNMCNACHKKQQWGGAETSLNGAVSKTSIRPEQKWDMLKMFSEEESNIKSNIEEDVTLRKEIKWYLAIKMKYVKTNQAGEEVASEPVFR